MRCITVTEPWASLIAISAKKIETRSWPTNYRGRIAIHAAKGMTGSDLVCARRDAYQTAFRNAGVDIDPNGIPTGRLKDVFADTRGCVIATATLVHCARFDHFNVETIRQKYGGDELDFGDFTPGRYGFVLTDVIRLPEPIPATGALGLWEFDPPAMEQAA